MTCSLALAALVAAPTTATAGEDCDKAAGVESASLQEVTVEELGNLLQKKAAVAVDANGAEARNKLGVIPGAVLLTSYSGFKTAELPADKDQTLVFYCYSEQCTAAPGAAKRAAKAGYQDVRVLASGIVGWRAAKMKVAQTKG